MLFADVKGSMDHAKRVCYAALRLRGELRRYADEVRVRHGLYFGTRIGMNSGEVVVGKIGDDLRMDYTAQGHTVGLAQRMEQLAPSDRVYLSERTARLVEGYFALRSLGDAKVQGVSEPWGSTSSRTSAPCARAWRWRSGGDWCASWGGRGSSGSSVGRGRRRRGVTGRSWPWWARRG